MHMFRNSFAEETWYHCYNRGIDKRIVFDSSCDYERFLSLLYLMNSVDSVEIRNLKMRSLDDAFNVPRAQTLVEIGAYCLLPNHFHLLLYEQTPGGITRFMRKLGTAYTMYFNIKNERVGNLFYKPFRAKHVDTDQYLQYVVQYIHINPAELYEPGWKLGVVDNLTTLHKAVLEYPYSSYAAHIEKANTPKSRILGPTIHNVVVPKSPEQTLREALLYYQSLPR
ncbi:MAG: transposase [Parcubacteria group bacterium Athens0416_74]|nr:MAG: transposase [Parcubacteria group bacterium Athens0416_74]